MNILALTFVSIIWGAAFVFQRTAMQHIGPFTLIFSRFFLAAFSVYTIRALFWKKTGFERPDLKAGVILGLVLFFGAVLQQFGMQETTAANGGFITGMYMVIIPFFLGFFWHERIALLTWLGVLVAAIGMYYFSISEGLKISPGDSLVFCCAVIYALHVILAGKLGSGRDVLALSIIQLIVAGSLSGISAFALEGPNIRSIWSANVEIAYLGFISAGLGYTLQLVYQRRVPEVLAGLILSLESVFAALAGALFLSEALTPRQLLGAALMLLGITLAQIKSGSKSEDLTLEH